MTERKFTRNLKSRGMAQQLRESVSKVIHQDLINVRNSHQLKQYSNHIMTQSILFSHCEFNYEEKKTTSLK